MLVDGVLAAFFLVRFCGSTVKSGRVERGDWRAADAMVSWWLQVLT